jgi:hypothetical protein
MTLIGWLIPSVQAGQENYLDWFKPANAHIRTAASYLRTGNIDFAALALQELTEAAMPQNLDGKLAQLAKTTVATARKALAQIDDGKEALARKTLLQLRQQIYAAHQTNNIKVFDDCIWGLVKKGPALWHYKKNPPDFSDSAAVAKTAKAASDYLKQLNLCDGQASAKIKADQAYHRIVTGARESLQRISTEALAQKDAGLLYRFIIELRSFDRLLYFGFG